MEEIAITIEIKTQKEEIMVEIIKIEMSMVETDLEEIDKNVQIEEVIRKTEEREEREEREEIEEAVVTLEEEEISEEDIKETEIEMIEKDIKETEIEIIEKEDIKETEIEMVDKEEIIGMINNIEKIATEEVIETTTMTETIIINLKQIKNLLLKHKKYRV